MPKSPDAFRTISEVADWLGVQAHVLRFWESKFSQIKPIKRAGGRRYYRPADMLLLGGIKKLLHDDGMTIKGAQKLLRENGTAHVADLSQPLDDLTVAVIEGTAEDVTDKVHPPKSDTTAAPQDAERATPEDTPLAEEVTESEPLEAVDGPSDVSEIGGEVAEHDDPAQVPESEANVVAFDAQDEAEVAPETEAPASELLASTEPEADTPDPEPAPVEKFEVSPPQPKETPKPRIIDVGPLPDLADFPEVPSVLSSIGQISSLTPDEAAAIKPLLARLTRLRASMASSRKDAGKD